MHIQSRHPLVSFGLLFALGGVACARAPKDQDDSFTPTTNDDASVGSDEGIQLDDSEPSGLGGDGFVPSEGGTGDMVSVDPATCEEAAANKTYVGCDFWPTVVANNVWSIFDFAVVIANSSDDTVTAEVTGNGIAKKTVTVAPQSLTKVYLPWNATLKGDDCDSCGSAKTMPGSVYATKGAYHLVASRPVTVYQFNALEYKGQGGEAGKDWSSCPGSGTCNNPLSPANGKSIGCYSFSNDASLLLPSTAMTGDYRVTGIFGLSTKIGTTEIPGLSSYVAITATQDGTKVQFTSKAKVLAGGPVSATDAGGVINLDMNAGDVVELVAEPKTSSDLSGSLVKADKPVQVVTGIPCIKLPADTTEQLSCDHVEESVFPAQTWGKDYIVAPPTTPTGGSVGHTVRFYGNRDGTTLTYQPSQPSGAPSTLSAGQVVTIDVTSPFRVTGDNEFAVGIFQWSGSKVDPGGHKGDPSMSFATPVQQYRTKYIFLTPDDYPVSYVDIVYPTDAKVTVDGAPISGGSAIGTGYSLSRTKLGPGKGGAHTLESNKGVGIQVMGYGDATSYQYPGGLDLKAIAPPPPVK